jgi:hypothetical protein
MRPIGGAITAALLVALSPGLPPPPPSTPSATAPPQAAGPLQSPVASTCDAPALAYLVGLPKEEIPVPVLPSRRRVICDACPKSKDDRPERTTILFDANTGLVTAVTCG